MRQVYKGDDPDNEIYKISFYSPSHGFIGFRDWIGFTTDSGRTFTRKPITLNNVDYNGNGVNLTFGFGINGVKAFNQDTVLVYGDYGLVPSILLSTNGGNSFKLIYHSQYDPMALRTGIMDMDFPQNGSIGYAVDADRILKTTNRGLTWTANWYSPGSYFNSVQGVDHNNVIAYGIRFGTSKLLKTTNGGTTWILVGLPPDQVVSSAYFLTPSKGWLNTKNNNDGGHTYYTSNGGTSWSLKNKPAIIPFSTEKMQFINDSTGFALAGYQVYKTSDSGKIWQRLPRDNSFVYLGYHHNDLHLLNNQLWAGGGFGFLELSSNGGGNPIPGAYFQIDTTNYLETGNVRLVNHSKSSHQYQWLANNSVVGTSYHASYQHNVHSLLDSITLIVSNGGYADTLKKYQHFYPPVIVSSFTPTTAAGGVTVIIKGINFTGATAVSFGGSPASFTVLSDTAIRATVGAGASGSVRVETPTGRGSLAGFIFIPPPAPIIFTPTSATAGTTITIHGKNFIDVTAVKFGGVQAASFAVVNDSTLTAVVGAGATGNISVTAVGGTGSISGFTALPNITQFTPTSGTFGTYMTITGTGFGDVKSVSVGGIPVASFTVNSHTSISAILHNGASGNVLVTTPAGSSRKENFNYHEPPVITAFTPTSGPVGTTLTINGSNFNPIAGENTVYFGAVKASVVSATANTLTIKVPTGATFQPISVTSHHLTTYSEQPFLVTFPNGGTITPNSFANRIDLNTGSGTYPFDGAAGDLDGDGKTDLLVLNGGTYVNETAISVFRNTTDGSTISFAPKVDYLVPDPGGIAVADIDGDGKLDFAVTDGDTYKVSVFRNTSSPGLISFAPRVDLTTTRMGGKIAIKDMDGDGKPDLVASSWWEGGLVIHRNISNPGGIAFGPRINIQGSSERNMVLQDMDRDGKPEIIDMGRIIKNTSTRGSISFGATTTFRVYTHSYVTAGDVDRDGKIDIVTSDQNGSKVAVFRNIGSNNIAVADPVEYPATTGPAAVDMSDLDGDGKLDIATSLYDYSLAVFKNNSQSGSFDFSPKIDYAAHPVSTDNKIVIADINGDGKPDPIVFVSMRRSVSIFVNDVKPEPFIASFTPTIGVSGTSILIKGRNFSGTTEVRFGGIPAASFTIQSDSTLSAIVGNGAAGVVSVTNNIGTGIRPGFTFGFPPSITAISPRSGAVGSSVTITGTYFSNTTAENMVYFGSMQAVVTAASANSLTVTVPKGSLYQPISVTVNGKTAHSTTPFSTTFPGALSGFTANSFGDTLRLSNRIGTGSMGDVDGDGKVDLVSTTNNKIISVSLNTSTAGSPISFAPLQNIAVYGSPAFIGFGDVDGNGKQDILVTYSDSAYVSVVLNQSTPGKIAFAQRVNFSTGHTASAYGPVLRDLDLDGKPDLIIAGYSPRTISVYKNKSTEGNVSFDSRIDYLLDGYATDIKVEDINGDGLPELVAPVNATNEVSVFKNTSVPGTISFALKADTPVGDWPQSLFIGDLDDDGKADVVVANLNGHSVSVLKNNSSANNIAFSKTDLPITYRPWYVWINDMDGDGKADLCVQKESGDYAEPNQRSVNLYKNTSIPGTISFQPPVGYKIGDYTIRSASGDLNGDGKPEMLVYNSFVNNSSALLIFQNKVGEATTVSVCEGSNTTITSNLAGSTYQWQQNTGSGFINLSNGNGVNGTTTASLHLSGVALNQNGYQYRCVVGSDTSVLSVLQVNALPLAVAGQDKTVCVGGTGTFIGGATVLGNTYSWSPATGLSNTDVAAPYANPTATTQYILKVTRNGCSNMDTVMVSLYQPPTPTITAAGPTGFCIGESVQLSSSAATGNQWFKDGILLPNDTLQTYPAKLAGRYTVRTTLNGCTSVLSPAVNVQAGHPPVAPVISAGGPTTICQGSQVLLSVTDTSGITWYKDGVIIPGAIGGLYKAEQSGSYTAKRITNGCASSFSSAIVITVNNTVSTPLVTAAGATVGCRGDSLLLRSSSTNGNQWFRNGVAINGATYSTIMVGLSGTYSVVSSVNGCNSNISNGVAITINDIPPTPVLTQNGNTLSSSALTGNQWYLNGTALNGDTLPTLKATASGVYTVLVKNGICSSKFSNAITLFTIPGVVTGPNPVTDKLLIQFPNNTETLAVLLMDMNGQSVLDKGTFVTHLEINMEKYTPGTYIIQIINERTGAREQRIILKL